MIAELGADVVQGFELDNDRRDPLIIIETEGGITNWRFGLRVVEGEEAVVNLEGDREKKKKACRISRSSDERKDLTLSQATMPLLLPFLLAPLRAAHRPRGRCRC